MYNKLTVLIKKIIKMFSPQLAGGLIVTERVSSNLRIFNIAKRHVGSLLWSQDSELHGTKKKDKCAMFVYDVITEAGLTAPRQQPW